jgi:hypothetical protein
VGRLVWFFVIALVVFAPISFAENRVGQQEVHVHLVEVPVLVLGSDGQPVEDLDAADLRAEVKGREVAIDSVVRAGDLRHVDEDLPQARMYVDLGARGNLAKSGEFPVGRVLLFVDLVHGRSPDAKEPAETMASFARYLLEQGRQVAVASFDGGFRLETPFTGDALLIDRALRDLFSRNVRVSTSDRRLADLARSLAQCEHIPDNPFVNAEDGQDLLESNPGIIADGQCARSAISIFAQQSSRSAEAFYTGLDMAVRYAGTVRDGAQVIAVSRGESPDPLPQAQATFLGVFDASQQRKIDGVTQSGGLGESLLDRLAATAADLDVRIHFVSQQPGASPGQGAIRRYMRGPSEDPFEVALRGAERALRRVANGSGGVLLKGSTLDDLLGRVSSLETGFHSVYLYDEPGLDRRLVSKVRITSRRSGLVVTAGRARAWGKSSIPGQQARFVLRDRESSGASERRDFRLDLALDPRDYRKHDNGFVTNLALEVRLMTLDGRLVATFYDLFQHSVAPDGLEKTAATALGVPGWIEAEPGGYRLDALLRCPVSGREASAVIEIEIPDGVGESS